MFDPALRLPSSNDSSKTPWAVPRVRTTQESLDANTKAAAQLSEALNGWLRLRKESRAPEPVRIDWRKVAVAVLGLAATAAAVIGAVL